MKASTWYFGVVEFCGVVATALGVLAGWLVGRGDVTVGTVVAVVLLLASLFEPVLQLSQLYNTVQAATASLKKMFDILDTEPEIDEHHGAVDLPTPGPLVVDEVSFTYPGAINLLFAMRLLRSHTASELRWSGQLVLVSRRWQRSLLVSMTRPRDRSRSVGCA